MMISTVPTLDRVGALGLTGLAALALSLNPSAALAGGGDGGSEPPSGSGVIGDGDGTISLIGTVRDFRENDVAGGHPDFEYRPDAGFGHYCGNVAPFLGGDTKPVFTGDGFKVTSQWRDSESRPICYLLYDPAAGDQQGSVGTSDTGGIQSAETFNQWFNDVPGINLAKDLALVFHEQEDGTFVFDDKDDPLYSSLGGFFPLEDQLFGNPGGSPDRNFHFTFELHTEFRYDKDAAYMFKFIGDDDVWVYIGGQLVIDLGGVHVATEQYVDLDRLNLDDGKVYTLDFFFAERHRTQSNFRVETNIPLVTVSVPDVTAAFD